MMRLGDDDLDETDNVPCQDSRNLTRNLSQSLTRNLSQSLNRNLSGNGQDETGDGVRLMRLGTALG